MSGPVSNSLAQLEDALLEAGLDKALIVSALAAQLHALDSAYSGLRLNKVLRQRLWDHCARLSPKWREITSETEHEAALRCCCERDHDGDGRCDRHRPPLPPLPPLGWRPLNFPAFTYSAAPRAVEIAALARRPGKTAMAQEVVEAIIQPTLHEEVSVRSVNWGPRSRVPEFLQHKPGRQRRR